MKKIITSVVSLILLTCVIAGCGNGSASGKADDTAYLDYINKVEIGDTLEEMNAALGCEGVQHENSKQTYIWTFERGGMSAVFKDCDEPYAISIDLDYEYEDVVNNKVKIKNLEELKKKVGDGMTYEEFKEFMGGVDGILESKNSGTLGYVWKSSNGSIVNASFRTDDNLCNNFVGTEK